MKEKAWKRYALMLSLAAALSCTSGWGADRIGISLAAPSAKEQQQLDNAAAQKKKLEAEKKRTEEMIGELNGLKADVTVYVEKLDQNLTKIAGEIDRLNGDIAAKEEQLQTTGAELDLARADAEEQYGDMKLRIRYMYEKGNTGFLELLLSSANLTEFFNRAEYVRKISEYDRKQLDLYEALCRDIEEKQQQLEREKAELLSLQGEEKAKQESVKALMTEKLKEIERYSAEIGDAQDELSSYSAQIAAQEEEIKAVEEAVKKREEEERKKAEEERKRLEAQGGGKSQSTTAKKSLGDIRFTWPCPASSRVSSGFGRRSSPKKGASSYHQGIDIAAATGTSIVAAAEGEVVTASYSGSAGNYIMISHGGGVYSLYMHCSQLNVSTGQHVSAGQTIGKVGSTGISTGPHLHFGIRSGGQYLNPASYVSP